MLLSGLLFFVVFSINLVHLRHRRIPLYTWGTVIACVHMVAGVISWMCIPIAAVAISLTVEGLHAVLRPEERRRLDQQFADENAAADQRVRDAQQAYEDLYCLASYTVEMDFDYRNALRLLDQHGIWHFERGGLITSILVKPADAGRAMAILGLETTEPDAPGSVDGI